MIRDADAKRHGHGNNLEEDVVVCNKVVVVVESREISSSIGTTHSIVVTLLLRFIDLCILAIIFVFSLSPEILFIV